MDYIPNCFFKKPSRSAITTVAIELIPMILPVRMSADFSSVRSRVSWSLWTLIEVSLMSLKEFSIPSNLVQRIIRRSWSFCGCFVSIWLFRYRLRRGCRLLGCVLEKCYDLTER